MREELHSEGFPKVNLFLATVTLTKVTFDPIKVKRSIRGTYIPNMEDIGKEIRAL